MLVLEPTVTCTAGACASAASYNSINQNLALLFSAVHELCFAGKSIFDGRASILPHNWVCTKDKRTLQAMLAASGRTIETAPKPPAGALHPPLP